MGVEEKYRYAINDYNEFCAKENNSVTNSTLT